MLLCVLCVLFGGREPRLHLQPESPYVGEELLVRAFGPDGGPVHAARIELLDPSRTPIDDGSTDPSGATTFRLEAAGDYILRWSEPGRGTVLALFHSTQPAQRLPLASCSIALGVLLAWSSLRRKRATDAPP